MNNKEKVEILLKYFGNEKGNINLSYIDFGNRIVFNSGQQAYIIFNDYQEANIIYNDSQKTNTIYNYNQNANIIFNDSQKANKIYNDSQVIKPNYENMTKEQLIARIKELEK